MLSYEDMIMLEIVDCATGCGDGLDFVLGGDTDIHPSDFDSSSSDGIMLGMIDILLDNSDSPSED